ncbi:MAG: ImmA/IrrE family metallo-endopeptidase [Clostridiales bacterium]|nr:ImmA/IrrE family metallo-endopeptidase [Clostridiales bacterium]
MNKSRQRAIEKIALNMRDKCNVISYGFQNIFESAQKVGYRVIRYPVGKDSLLGFAMIKDGDRIIFSNSSLILSREIFTIAHEIGHQKLHLSETDKIFIKDIDFDEKNEFEYEANYFASCLLMPEEKVRNFIKFELNEKHRSLWNGFDIARLQTAFSTSYEMTLIRLKVLEIIDGELFDRLKMEKIEQSASKLLHRISGNVDLCKSSEFKSLPAEVFEWVISNYNERLIPVKSLQTALNYVDLRVEELDKAIINVDQEKDDESESFDDLLRGMD